jgi:hypothetical protein
MKFWWRALCGALFFLYSTKCTAFVTSAVLEYSCANRVDFYLNGQGPLKGRNSQEDHWLDYAVLDSADGSLPLHYFRNNADNVLAADNWSLGPVVGLSFRLTLYQSSGDPIVVWSEPHKTRVFHCDPGQMRPFGWEKPAFDDADWPGAGVTDILLSPPSQPNSTSPTPTPGPSQSAAGQSHKPGEPPHKPKNQEFFASELEDSHFQGHLGETGFVPWVSHNDTGWAAPLTHNFIRAHFRFPDTPDRVEVLASPSQASQGKAVSVRLVPGKDSASYSRFNLFAYLPAGLDLSQMPAGGRYDPATRRLSWAYVNQVKTMDLFLDSVLDAGGWIHAERALGGAKEGTARYHQGLSDLGDREGTAEVQSGLTGWFKLAGSGMADGPQSPRILGVMFHSQIRPQGYHGYKMPGEEYDDRDGMVFNYSVDGFNQGSLRRPRNVSTLAMDQYFCDGYYDATRDRDWTWADINNLRVSFTTTQKWGRKFADALASCDVTVSYYQPLDTAPTFYTRVTESRPKKLALWAMVQDAETNNLAKDYALVDVNQAAPVLAAVVPTATAVPASVSVAAPSPVAVAVAQSAPAPAPVAVVPQQSSVAAPVLIGLEGLQSSPEPFQRGGVFIYFKLRSGANVSLAVFSGSSQVRSLDLGHFGPGNNQAFYSGGEDGGKPLAPGNYTYRLTAKAGSSTEAREGRFSRAEDEFKGL